MIKHESPTVNISMAGPAKSLVIHFNRVASDLMNLSSVVCLFRQEEIILREAGLFDDNSHKVSVGTINNSKYKRIGISGARDKEIFCGLYNIEKIDSEFILTKVL